MKWHDWIEILFLQNCKPSLAWFRAPAERSGWTGEGRSWKARLKSGADPYSSGVSVLCPSILFLSLLRGSCDCSMASAVKFSLPVKGFLQCSYSCVMFGKPLTWSPPPLLVSSLFLQTTTGLYHWPTEQLSFCSWTMLFPFYFSLPNEVCLSWQKFRLAEVHVSIGCLKLSSNHVYSLSASLESWTDFFFPPHNRRSFLKIALGIFLRLWFKVL